MGKLYMLDETLIPNNVAHSPPCGVECFPDRTNGKSVAGDRRAQSGDTCECGGEMKEFVDLIRENDNAVLQAHIADFKEFFGREDFPKRIMPIRQSTKKEVVSEIKWWRKVTEC